MSSGSLKLQRGVKLRPIKRYNEGPFLELTPNTKEEYASTGGESPPPPPGGGGGGVRTIISEGTYSKDRAIKMLAG